MNQIPMSPTLLKKLPIDDYLKNQWLQKRQEIIDEKESNVIVDDRLRDYQNKAVAFFNRLNNCGVFDQQRLGKTPTVLTSMRLKNQHNALIVVPKITLLQWGKEYEKWHGGKYKVVSADIYNPKEREDIYKNFKGSIIINKQLLNRDIDLLEKRIIDTMVVDEVHHLYTYKGAKAKMIEQEINGKIVRKGKPNTVQNIIRLSKKVKYRYALSGTVSPKTPQQIYGVLAFLYPDLFKSYWGFIEYYFKVNLEQVAWNKEIRVIDGWQSLEKQQELMEFLELTSVQRKRSEYMKWLTEADIEYVWLQMNDKLREEYTTLNQFYEVSNPNVIVTNDLTRLIKEEQLISDPRLLDLNIESPKTEWFRQFIKDYPEDSILVISPYTSYLKLLHKETKGSMLIHGGTPIQAREELKNKFNTLPKQILFANIDTIMEGISLYGADSLIVLNRDWVPGKNEQVFDRILATSPEQAKEMGDQNIYIVQVEAPIDIYKHEVLKERQELNTIINNYPKWIEKFNKKEEK